MRPPMLPTINLLLAAGAALPRPNEAAGAAIRSQTRQLKLELVGGAAIQRALFEITFTPERPVRLVNGPKQLLEAGSVVD
jgi:hypothetical protein